MRGHGAVLGGIDMTVHVTKTEGGYRTAKVIKANDEEEGQEFTFTLESEVLEVREEGTELAAPIVVPANPPTMQSGRRKLVGAARTAHAR
jgi:hypothetical protein